GPERNLDGADAGMQHVVELAEALLRKLQGFPELRDLIVGDQGRYQVAAAFRHETRRGLVDEIAVLDRTHACPDRTLDRLRNVGMPEGIGPPRLRFFHGRADLLLGVLDHVDRIVWRGDAASSHDLDLLSPALELLADRAPHRIDAVGDVAEHRRADRAR